MEIPLRKKSVNTFTARHSMLGLKAQVIKSGVLNQSFSALAVSKRIR
jgi:hypothetical protein